MAADVGMIESGGCARFLFNRSKAFGIVGQFARKEFHRDSAAQLEIFSLVHHSHAPASQHLQNPVMGDLLAYSGFAQPGYAPQRKAGVDVATPPRRAR